MDELNRSTARTGQPAPGDCVQASPGWQATLLASDLAIALASMSLLWAIGRLWRQRPETRLGDGGSAGPGGPWRRMAGTFSLFSLVVVIHGLAQLLDAWPSVRPDAVGAFTAKVVAALASVIAAGWAWRLTPQRSAGPSSLEALRSANEALQHEVNRRRTVEDDLLATEQSLAAALGSIDAGFIATDRAGKVTRMNSVAERICGWSLDEARGHIVWDVFERLDRPVALRERNPVDATLDHMASGGGAVRVTCQTRQGPCVPVEVSANVLRDAHGEARGLGVVFRDLSPLTAAEAEVRRLAAVVESSADAIVVKTLDGRITNWNAAAQQMFGYSAAEAVGQPVQMLLPPEREAEEARILANLANGQQLPPFRTVRVTKDGRRIEISAQISPLRDAAGRIVGGVKSARDLTHQRQIETALRQSEARLRFALESAAIGDWELELRTGHIHRSRRYDHCFGMDNPQEAWHREQMLEAIHADDRPDVAAALLALPDAEKPWHAEFRVVWRDGSLHWLRLDARIIRDDLDGPRLVGIVADVTAMRTAEQARQQSIWLAAENRRVQESSRLKSLFLANMSHELRTPLNAVIGFSDLLLDDAQPLDAGRRRQWLQHIANSGRHLLNMINDVLDLSKIEAGKMDFHPVPIDLPALIDEVMSTVAVLAEQRGVRLESSIAPDLHDLVLDPARLRQVLLNYLSNAIKFTGAGGRVELRATGEGPWMWRLEVQDSGIGIAPEQLKRLFVEFQQLDDGFTKHHQGTGLGLALTRRLVAAQGGRVGVYSEPDQGSCFYAVLPRDANRPSPEAAPAVRSQLVALVDHPLRDGLARELARAGMHTDTAATAAEVLKLARVRRYTELALDLGLPDAPGLRTLAALRDGGPSMHVAVKALALNAPMGPPIAFPVTDVLAKPLRRLALARALVPLRDRLGPERPILVVDDQAQAREVMRGALEVAGVPVVMASGGAEALELLQSLQPGAIVLDLMMPEVDGFSVLRQLRSDPRWAELPVLVWTALNLSADDIEALTRAAQEQRTTFSGDLGLRTAIPLDAEALRPLRNGMLPAARRSRHTPNA